MTEASAPRNRLIRHDMVARFMHWLMAVCILALLVTGLLPVVGVEFGWVTIHWIAGLVLAVGVVLHILRSFFGGRLKEMWFRGRDFRAMRDDGVKPGKYSFAQKAMHNSVALFGLAVVITGILMMWRIDAPIWPRDPYILSEQVWGIVYVVHGLSALVFLSLVMLHFYFSLRPEKTMYLRSMVKGWMTDDEYRANHDPAAWTPKAGKD